jgi:hypothetical protein
LTCLGVAASAQEQRQQPQAPTPPAPADIAVEKYDWSKERIDWQRDPFGGPVESFDDMRRRRIDERRLQRARAGGNIGEAAKVEQEMRAEQVIKARPPKPPRYVFQYKLTLRNNGDRVVREIDWDYVFLDAATGQELSRREFTAIERIAPGKRKELAFLISSPPTHKISAHALDKRERDGLVEQVVLMRVLYDDGTVWRRP